MIYFMAIVFADVLLQASACPDPITTVHIQNHDGPIYLSPSDTRLPYDNQITIGNRSPIYTTCCNQSPTYTTCGNQSPTHIPCGNQSPTYTTCGNQSPACTTCGNQSPTCTTCGNQSPQLLHNSNYPNYHTVCETDCKCVTKQLGTCVPINTVPQNTGTPGTYYTTYPAYGYGHSYPEGQNGSEGSCPITTEGLIPLLKSYIGQSKCPKHGYHCGQNYSCN